jgi:hypothetical protein
MNIFAKLMYFVSNKKRSKEEKSLINRVSVAIFQKE